MVYLNMRNGITAKKGKLVKSYTLTTVEESIIKVHEEREIYLSAVLIKSFPDLQYTVNYCRGLSGE